MCGTSIEADHVLINPHAVIGYPVGPAGGTGPAATRRIRTTWTVGTALRSGHGRSVSRGDSYDQLVDSPILLGRLTDGRGLVVTGVPVEIYAYSEDRQDQGADSCSSAMDGMLDAAGRLPRPACRSTATRSSITSSRQVRAARGSTR